MAKSRSSVRRETSAELSRVIDDIERTRGDRGYVPRARPKRMGDVVAQLLARRGYAQGTSAAEMAAAWNTVVGESMAASTRVGGIRRGTLEVVVANSAVAQELTFRKEELIGELASRLREHEIKNIRFRTGHVGQGE